MNRIAWMILGGLSVGLAGGCETDNAGDNGVNQNTTISGPSAQSGVGEDAAFMRQADIINTAEVRAGELALERAQHPDVRRFAEMLVQDHQSNLDQLQQLAQTQNVDLPDDLDTKHRQMLERFTRLQGAEFDRVFIDEMVKGHQEAVSKFEDEVRTGQNPQVKSYAANTLPTLRHHLQFAKDIQSRLNGDMGGDSMPGDMNH